MCYGDAVCVLTGSYSIYVICRQEEILASSGAVTENGGSCCFVWTFEYS